jgi:hypothetical protein
MCAEHEFVPGNILSHWVQKKIRSSLPKMEDGIRTCVNSSLLQWPHQLRGTVGFLRWSNQLCEQRRSPRAACFQEDRTFAVCGDRERCMVEGKWRRLKALGPCQRPRQMQDNSVKSLFFPGAGESS